MGKGTTAVNQRSSGPGGGRRGEEETSKVKERRTKKGTTAPAYFIDIVSCFWTRGFEQTLAPIRIAGLERSKALDGPSTYRHGVQQAVQRSSRCVDCGFWFGGGASRRSRKRPFFFFFLLQTLEKKGPAVGGVVGLAQGWSVQKKKKPEKKQRREEEGIRKKKTGGWGVCVWAFVKKKDEEGKNFCDDWSKKATDVDAGRGE